MYMKKINELKMNNGIFEFPLRLLDLVGMMN